MKKTIIKSFSISSAVIAGIFTFVPEALFGGIAWLKQEFIDQTCFKEIDANDINIVISRLLCFFSVYLIVLIGLGLFKVLKRCIKIKGDNYIIQIEYGDILKVKNCKRVFNFDECFTTEVGDTIAAINPNSICGQYLKSNPSIDINSLIESSGIKPAKSKSKYQGKVRYTSGTIVPNGDDLLLAFVPLDEKGKGRFDSRDEYLECLKKLWEELENYYSENDVCIPILGAGTTVFEGGNGASISQQELLDIIVKSYELSSHKIKAPHKLRIVCRKNDGFSINKMGE